MTKIGTAAAATCITAARPKPGYHTNTRTSTTSTNMGLILLFVFATLPRIPNYDLPTRLITNKERPTHRAISNQRLSATSYN